MSRYKIVVLTLGLFFLISCSDERESALVERSDIVESVYSSVIIEPMNMYQVNSSVTGYLEKVFAFPGDEVEVGDILFHIRDVQGTATASNARLNYELAQKNYSGDRNQIDDLRLDINSANLKRQNDSINHHRNKLLYEKNVLTKVELEQSELMYSSSKNNYSSLKNKLVRMERELKVSLDQAKNNYNSSVSRSDDAAVRAIISGKVYDVFKEQGEFVSVQEPIAVLGSKDEFSIKMLIDEVDITRIKKGQKIVVTLEAYKSQSFEAKVTHITPKMDGRTQTFEIEGVFVDFPSELYMGLTGEGNIVVKQIKEALVIPREYLIDLNKVETENGMKKVKIGVQSLSHVEIISGLKEGEEILKPL